MAGQPSRRIEVGGTIFLLAALATLLTYLGITPSGLIDFDPGGSGSSSQQGGGSSNGGGSSGGGGSGPPPPPPHATVYLGALTPNGEGDTPRCCSVTIGGEVYAKSIYYDASTDGSLADGGSVATYYDLNGTWSSLRGNVGLEPDASDILGCGRYSGKPTWAIFTNHSRVLEGFVPCSSVEAVHVPLKGVHVLELTITAGSCTPQCSGEFAWANARITR